MDAIRCESAEMTAFERSLWNDDTCLSDSNRSFLFLDANIILVLIQKPLKKNRHQRLFSIEI
jgi:hypothetical protein